MATLKGFFESPGFWYNFLNFVWATLGVALAVWGLWLALVQIRKTLAAAKAAKEASLQTAAEMRRITTLVSTLRLTSFSAEVLHLIRSRNYGGAVIRCQDLRAGVTELRSSPDGRRIQPDDSEWQAMVTQIVTVQEILERVHHASGGAEFDLRKCLSAISDVDATLRGLGSRAAQNKGA